MSLTKDLVPLVVPRLALQPPRLHLTLCSGSPVEWIEFVFEAKRFSPQMMDLGGRTKMAIRTSGPYSFSPCPGQKHSRLGHKPLCRAPR